MLGSVVDVDRHESLGQPDDILILTKLCQSRAIHVSQHDKIWSPNGGPIEPLPRYHHQVRNSHGSAGARTGNEKRQGVQVANDAPRSLPDEHHGPLTIDRKSDTDAETICLVLTTTGWLATRPPTENHKRIVSE